MQERRLLDSKLPQKQVINGGSREKETPAKSTSSRVATQLSSPKMCSLLSSSRMKNTLEQHELVCVGV